MLYVGVDVHKLTSQVTVMDASGSVVERKKIASSPMAVQQTLGRYEEPLTAVLEASYAWAPMYDWLDDVADEVVLAHPLKVRAIAEARIKTDKIDSETLAHLLRADLIPRAHASSKATRARKRVLRQRMFFVRVRTMVRNRIRALLVQHAVDQPRASDLFGRSGLEWLRKLSLPDPDGRLLQENLAFLELLQTQIAQTDNLIAQLALGDVVVQNLASVPDRKIPLRSDPLGGGRHGAVSSRKEVCLLHGAGALDVRIRESNGTWEAD